MRICVIMGSVLLVLSLMVNVWLYSTYLSQTSRLHDAAINIQELEEGNSMLEYEVAILENRVEVYRTTWDQVISNAKTIQSIGLYDTLAEFVLRIVIPTYPLKTVPLR